MNRGSLYLEQAVAPGSRHRPLDRSPPGLLDPLAARWPPPRQSQPRIFAGLLDGICCALRDVGESRFVERWKKARCGEEPRLIKALKWADGRAEFRL
jgi:hypothetical protein